MMSFATILILACAASAATLKPRAECHAKKHESCAFVGQRGCEHNGGHTMECNIGLRMENIWFKGENCAEKNAHCDCVTGSCVPNRWCARKYRSVLAHKLDTGRAKIPLAVFVHIPVCIFDSAILTSSMMFFANVLTGISEPCITDERSAILLTECACV
ncbi:hypothetical protein HBI57_206890 [Parastagonospora nodorum]|nr:hypothetical protein HBI79_209790 [Parastagonospora nodorum]KAH5238891.1 hypothetical protein HBI72_224660 [Parastagonospora nodorum]KAH6420787.1 hypothetical protein HBI14_080720 [Parastagonospora nodorum]KAH6447961.1 hypothetical protein HBI57_206890 [Parastagonospora nodorum]KAH6467196.1 hypothetical protein HBI58_168990 [Parastagonospora nodorum]